jgi:hypothetical protein
LRTDRANIVETRSAATIEAELQRAQPTYNVARLIEATLPRSSMFEASAV